MVEDRLDISSEDDVIAARQQGRKLASGMGFSIRDQSMLTAVITELARNILEYAMRGEMHFQSIEGDGRRGLEVIARDTGPGIPDIRDALETAYSVAGGLGVGLRGARAIMDTFEITSTPGRGTTVKARKWLT